jgi:hypothetical protein
MNMMEAFVVIMLILSKQFVPNDSALYFRMALHPPGIP